MDWLDLLAVHGTLKSLLQHHRSNASILQRSAFFTVQLSHSYMTTGKTIALTRWTFFGKGMSLLLNMLSGLVITFLPRSKRLLISWWQSPSAVILEPPKNKVTRYYFELTFSLITCLKALDVEFGGWGRHGRGILFIIICRSGRLNISGKRTQVQLYNASKH